MYVLTYISKHSSLFLLWSISAAANSHFDTSDKRSATYGLMQGALFMNRAGPPYIPFPTGTCIEMLCRYLYICCIPTLLVIPYYAFGMSVTPAINSSHSAMIAITMSRCYFCMCFLYMRYCLSGCTSMTYPTLLYDGMPLAMTFMYFSIQVYEYLMVLLHVQCLFSDTSYVVIGVEWQSEYACREFLCIVTYDVFCYTWYIHYKHCHLCL
jgi:hypothetical protein